jgi:hypothetical protein
MTRDAEPRRARDATTRRDATRGYNAPSRIARRADIENDALKTTRTRDEDADVVARATDTCGATNARGDARAGAAVRITGRERARRVRV